MKKSILITLAGLMAIPAFAASASAHPAPFYHIHPALRRAPTTVFIRKRRRARRVIVRRTHTRTVIVRQPRTVIVRQPVARTVVVRHGRRRSARKSKLGLSLRATTTDLGGLKLGLNSSENPTMGGVGLSLKSKIGKHFGLELSVDALTGSGNDFTQTTVPIMGSVTYNFMPNSRLQPYALVGIGAHVSSLNYANGKFKYDVTEAAAQAGVGIEFFLTPTLSLSADLRATTVLKNLDTAAKVRDDCLTQVGSKTGFCGGINGANPNDKVNVGVTGNIGATLYF
jgi:hypothetical protein